MLVYAGKILRFTTSSFSNRTVPSANPRVRRCGVRGIVKALVSGEIENQPLRHKLIGLRDPLGQVAVRVCRAISTSFVM